MGGITIQLATGQSKAANAPEIGEARSIEALDDLTKLVWKLRWIGMQDEAKALINTIPPNARACLSIDEPSTD